MSSTIRDEVDVLVAGGGTAGAVAAIQAARAGAVTALVEMTGQLGGTITNGGVSAPAHFFTRHGQVIGGIGWELVHQAREFEGQPFPDYQNPPPHRPQRHVGVNPRLYVLLTEETVLRAGVALHYHEVVTAAEDLGERWRVTTVGKGIRREILCREIIDCTGDADLVGLLGFERIGAEVRQPGTLTFRLDGYDPANLDEALIEQRYQQAMAAGELQPGDFYETTEPFIVFLQRRGANQQHIFNADSSTAVTQTEANLAGRASLLRLLRFVRTLPGCEGVKLAMLCGATAVRETWRIAGETTISREDYLAGRNYPDAIGYTFYFIDVHHERGIEREFLADGVVPTLPLGALIPRGSRRLLVAGRTISSDRLAHSALRVEASCMAMGQGAGAAAALGVRLGCASRDVPHQQLRALLLDHGAILPA
ncbi:MAG: FAD-dependent oxidoreductase, partial [Armatimonadetes bacterium]|nr:FAD-dependent oxidoreductase [Armatimonadota bacterium]